MELELEYSISGARFPCRNTRCESKFVAPVGLEGVAPGGGGHALHWLGADCAVHAQRMNRNKAPRVMRSQQEGPCLVGGDTACVGRRSRESTRVSRRNSVDVVQSAGRPVDREAVQLVALVLNGDTARLSSQPTKSVQFYWSVRCCARCATETHHRYGVEEAIAGVGSELKGSGAWRVSKMQQAARARLELVRGYLVLTTHSDVEHGAGHGFCLLRWQRPRGSAMTGGGAEALSQAATTMQDVIYPSAPDPD